MFRLKLDKLMKHFNIPNNRLAKALSVDPSLISRWRAGSRKPSANSIYYTSIAKYFAHLCSHPEDASTLFKSLHIDQVHTLSQVETVLEDWLKDPSTHTGKLINNFVDVIEETLSANSSVQPSKAHIKRLNELLAHSVARNELYYGNHGKRTAVLKFLAEVAKSEQEHTLLLFSNEKMDWLIEDPLFNRDWAIMLQFILYKGHSIKIIHTLNRGPKELIFAVEKWMPLYMTGKIEPCYIPEAVTGLFRKSIFLVEDFLALTASSISDACESHEQVLLKDKNRIKIVAQEFNTLLSLSKPLMKIVPPTHSSEIEDLKMEFTEESGPCYHLVSINDLGIPKIEDAYEYHEILVLTPNTHLLTEASLEQLRLRTQLIKQKRTYHLYISFTKKPHNFAVSIKPGTGVLIHKRDAPSLAFGFNHKDMISAFETYIKEQIYRLPSKQKNKKDVLNYINTFIQ